jgi:pimeloyl-ACP methyl ester carboxylesterase
MDRQQRQFAKLLPVLARLGVLRFAMGRVRGQLPDDAVAAMKAQDGSVAGARGHAAEVRSSIDDLRRLRDDPPVLPDVPVTLISGTKRSRFGQAKRDALVATHRAQAEALPQGRHVEAAASGHLVPFSEPDLVVTEILRIVRKP